MSEVRNPDKRFVCAVDAKKKVVERLEKGWVTRIEFKDDGSVDITHRKETA